MYGSLLFIWQIMFDFIYLIKFIQFVQFLLLEEYTSLVLAISCIRCLSCKSIFNLKPRITFRREFVVFVEDTHSIYTEMVNSSESVLLCHLQSQLPLALQPVKLEKWFWTTFSIEIKMWQMWFGGVCTLCTLWKCKWNSKKLEGVFMIHLFVLMLYGIRVTNSLVESHSALDSRHHSHCFPHRTTFSNIFYWLYLFKIKPLFEPWKFVVLEVLLSNWFPLRMLKRYYQILHFIVHGNSLSIIS